MLKPLKFVGSSLADLADFPEKARRQAGFELWQVQRGLMPSDFKPMLGGELEHTRYGSTPEANGDGVGDVSG